MERKIDRIKRLEHELGRYRKKVADQQAEVERLREMVAEADAGSRQAQAAVDAVLTAVALEHGAVAEDPDTGETICWRLTLPHFSVPALREGYELHARRDEGEDAYVLGVAPRRPPK